MTAKLATDSDRSRIGNLIHDAQAQGRHVDVIAYIEGLDDPRYEIHSSIICRTGAQAADVARVLRESRTDKGVAPATGDARQGLRGLLRHIMIEHPLPWRVDRDWTHEVIAVDGFVVVKCRTREEADSYVAEAVSVRAEDARRVEDNK